MLSDAVRHCRRRGLFWLCPITAAAAWRNYTFHSKRSRGFICMGTMPHGHAKQASIVSYICVISIMQTAVKYMLPSREMLMPTHLLKPLISNIPWPGSPAASGVPPFRLHAAPARFCPRSDG